MITTTGRSPPRTRTMTAIHPGTVGPTTAPAGGLMPAWLQTSMGDTMWRSTRASGMGFSGGRGITYRQSITPQITDCPLSLSE